MNVEIIWTLLLYLPITCTWRSFLSDDILRIFLYFDLSVSDIVSDMVTLEFRILAQPCWNLEFPLYGGGTYVISKLYKVQFIPLWQSVALAKISFCQTIGTTRERKNQYGPLFSVMRYEDSQKIARVGWNSRVIGLQKMHKKCNTCSLQKNVKSWVFETGNKKVVLTDSGSLWMFNLA